MTINTFAKHSFWTIFSQGIIFVVGLGTSIIVARALNPEGKGIYTLAAFLPSFLMYFASLGIGLAALFYLASGKYPSRVVFGNSLVCVFAHSAFAILMGLMLLYFAREAIFPGIAVEYLLLALLIVPSQLYLSFILPILLGIHRIREYNTLQVLRVILLFGLVLVFLIGLDSGVAGAIVAGALASYVTCMVSFVIVLRETKGISFKLDKGYLKDVYRYGIKLYAGSMLLFLNGRLNLILLNLYLNPIMAGFFSLAIALSEKVWLVADAIGTILYPKIASEKNEKRKNAFTPLVFRTTLLIVVLISVSLYTLGERLIVFFYSAAFMEAVRPFRILLVGVVAGSGWRILENDLKGRGRPGLVTVIMAVSLVGSILFNILLIPRYGLMGAAWAAVISASMSLLISIAVFCQVSGSKIGNLILFKKSDMRAYQGLVFSVVTSCKSRLAQRGAT